MDPNDLRISEFVDINRLSNPEILSRALSIELLLAQL